jgi:hypothetical protein
VAATAVEKAVDEAAETEEEPGVVESDSVASAVKERSEAKVAVKE